MASSITSNPKSIQAKTIQPAPVSMSTSSSAQNPSTLQSKIHKNSVPDPISRPEPVKPSHTDSDLRPPCELILNYSLNHVQVHVYFQ